MFRISVIVPAYNAALFIQETLASVKNQTYTNWECIIVDDGSTDNTAVIVKQWTVTDNRFIYIYQSNKGLSGARNTGIQNATGDLIQFLDADDVLLPQKFEKQLHHFENINANGLVVSYTDYLAGVSTDIYMPANYYMSPVFSSDTYVLELITRWEATLSIPPNCFLFSAAIFKEKKIQFDEQLPNHEDFDCWLSIFRLNPDIKYLNEKLCIYRVTEGSMSKNRKSMGEGFIKTLDKHINSKSYQKITIRELIKKRRAVLSSYRRFDLMSWKDKLLSIGTIYSYYSKRIFQKIGLSS